MSVVDEERQSSETLSLKDQYKIALETRNLEISLFWQRSNYFLILNSALALGFFQVESPFHQSALAIFGVVVSLFWCRVNFGSKFWQSRWENRLAVVERELAPSIDFFDAPKEVIEEDVKESLQIWESEKSWFRKWLDSLVMKKYSVSYYMTCLSIWFLAGWILLFGAIFFLP